MAGRLSGMLAPCCTSIDYFTKNIETKLELETVSIVAQYKEPKPVEGCLPEGAKTQCFRYVRAAQDETSMEEMKLNRMLLCKRKLFFKAAFEW
jgi:hypothetical protein